MRACKLCKRAAARAYVVANPGRRRDYLDENRESVKATRRSWYYLLRKEVIEGYGGECVCCGENEYAFLVFDHVDGGGTHERMAKYGGKRGRTSPTWLLELKKDGYPPHIQVLCANCNMAKTYATGGCPHQGR
jgi:hypothetical protein